MVCYFEGSSPLFGHNARLNPSLEVREHFSPILRQVGVGVSQKSLGALKIYAELPGAGQRKGS